MWVPSSYPSGSTGYNPLAQQQRLEPENRAVDGWDGAGESHTAQTHASLEVIARSPAVFDNGVFTLDATGISPAAIAGRSTFCRAACGRRFLVRVAAHGDFMGGGGCSWYRW